MPVLPEPDQLCPKRGPWESRSSGWSSRAG